MLYMVTFAINIPPMLAYIPYMDPMGLGTGILKKDGHSYGGLTFERNRKTKVPALTSSCFMLFREF